MIKVFFRVFSIVQKFGDGEGTYPFIGSARISRLVDSFDGTRGNGSLRRILVLALAGFTFAIGSPGAVTVAFAQTSNSQTGGQNQVESQITLNLQDVDIRVLINMVAEVSGKNFIVDPRVKGKVSVTSGAPLNPDQLYNIFLSILEVHNFATVDSGNVVKVLPSNVIKQRPTPTLFSPTDETNDAQITQIIQLKFASVQDLVPIVRPLIPPTSHFAPHVPSNSVVLTDTAANIQRVLKIIRRIDIPDKRSNVHVVYLEKTRATDLANTLTQLVATTADPKDAAAAAKLSIQPLDSINALVVSAPDDQFIKIQALIDELDIERELQSDVNVISLKHAKAEDLVSILNDVTATATEGAVSDFSVQADEASNSLIVKASGNQLKTVQNVVAKLDKRRAQVFVETVIAEVSETQMAAFGINLAAGGGRGAIAAVPAGPDGTGAIPAIPGLGNIVDSTSGQVIGTGAIGSAFALANAGFNASLTGFRDINLSVIVNAINEDSGSNILSTPTILTLDNEEAEIVVGQEVPFITGSFNTGFNNGGIGGGGVDGDGTTGPTTGQGFQTIERRDVGIMLRIKPQISDGDTIQLEIQQEISDVELVPIAGQSDLVTNRRSLEAIVQADDGQVVVLGGLLVDNVNDTESRVPFLGKLPVLGALFRTRGKTVTRSNLMIFLKPRIIRTPEQLAAFSKKKYEILRRDAIQTRENGSSLLIEDSEPPVLLDYEDALGEGELTTEREARLTQKAEDAKKPKERKGIRRLLFGKRKNNDEAPLLEEPNDVFKERGIEDELSDIEIKSIEAELSDGNENRIDWGKPATLDEGDLAPPIDLPIVPIDDTE